jgi:hypothetical protein
VVEAVEDERVSSGVSPGQIVKCLIREDNPPAKGIIGAITLDHRDVAIRPCLFHQEREIEAGWTAANTNDMHSCASFLFQTRSTIPGFDIIMLQYLTCQVFWRGAASTERCRSFSPIVEDMVRDMREGASVGLWAASLARAILIVHIRQEGPVTSEPTK